MLNKSDLNLDEETMMATNFRQLSVGLFLLLALAGLVRCAPADDRPKDDNSDQKTNAIQIEDGYYLSSQPSEKILPAISVVQIGDNTHVHSFLKYECHNKTIATFFQSGMSLGGRPVDYVAAPSVEEVDDCRVQSSAKAESETSLRVSVEINGEVQESYLLTKVDKRTFLKAVQRLSANVDSFEVSNETCQQSLGEPCSKVGLKDSDSGTYANN